MSINPDIKEIDEALKYAVATKNAVRDSKKPLVYEFIDDLLDARIEADCS